MTWRTPSGDRTLDGPEAALVTAILLDMYESLDEEAHDEADQWSYGVRLFDELSWPQRLNLLVVVGEGLFRPDVPPPGLSAVHEAALGALCKAVDQALRIELDCAKEAPEIIGDLDVHRWRRMILACHPPSDDPEYQLPIVSCPDYEEWDLLIQCLEDGMLWDDDWDMPELFLDVDPQLSRARRGKLGIPKDYYTAPAPDPRDDQIPELWSRLRSLTRESSDS